MPQPLVVILTLVFNIFFPNLNNPFLKEKTVSAADPVAEKIAQMSLKEKIRQTLVCSFNGTSSESALTVLDSCGNIIYFKNNLQGLSEKEIFTNNKTIHQKDSLAWIMIDQEGGRVSRIEDGSPSPRKMATENTVTYWGEQHGRLLKNLDFNVDLAPVADITENSPVITDRSFADDPTINGQKASEYLKSLQAQGILGVIKHLPGHGRVDSDTHKKSGELDYAWDEIKNFDLTPFIDTINSSGARIVMIGHIVIPEIDKKPASISPVMIEKLRQTLPTGNDLIFLTDSLSMAGVGLPQDEAVVEAFKAGEDMILYQGNSPDKIFAEILSAYKSGQLNEQSLNQSVNRILGVKTKYF